MPAVESTIHINRTPHDVFAFVSDYERDPRWRSEVVKMNYQSPGPTGIGRLALETSKVFGRRLETLPPEGTTCAFLGALGCIARSTHYEKEKQFLALNKYALVACCLSVQAEIPKPSATKFVCHV